MINNSQIDSRDSLPAASSVAIQMLSQRHKWPKLKLILTLSNILLRSKPKEHSQSFWAMPATGNNTSSPRVGAISINFLRIFNAEIFLKKIFLKKIFWVKIYLTKIFLALPF